MDQVCNNTIQASVKLENREQITLHDDDRQYPIKSG